MSKTNDDYPLSWLGAGLAAVSTRLEPRDAARISAEAAAVLVRAMRQTTIAHAFYGLMGSLAALTAFMEAREATAVSAEAAAVLVQALSRTNHANDLSWMSQGLPELAPRLEPGAARSTAAALAQAMTRTNDFYALNHLAEGLAGLASRLEPREAADVAATLISAFSRTKPPVGPVLTQGLTALLNGCDAPEHCQRAVAVAQVFATVAGPKQLLSGLALVGPAADPLSCRLSTQQLVELLKLPTCQDPARRVILDFLETRYQRPFRNHWEFGRLRPRTSAPAMWT